jgi:hypothetical protein
MAGFRDSTGYYLTATKHTGVWVSNEPLSSNEGANGDTLLEVTLSAPKLMSTLKNYEWIESGKPYREWLIPAKVLEALITAIKATRDDEGWDSEIET